MKWRGKFDKKKLGWRVIFLAVLPVAIVAVMWRAREKLKPVTVMLGPQPIESRVLFERMSVEAKRRPYARTIEVSWSRPWPEQSGLDLFASQSLRWDRSKATLFYSTSQYGWVYSHAESSGFDILAKTQLQDDPITLPASVHARLRARGWTLTEHYLP